MALGVHIGGGGSGIREAPEVIELVVHGHRILHLILIWNLVVQLVADTADLLVPRSTLVLARLLLATEEASFVLAPHPKVAELPGGHLTPDLGPHLLVLGEVVQLGVVLVAEAVQVPLQGLQVALVDLLLVVGRRRVLLVERQGPLAHLVLAVLLVQLLLELEHGQLVGVGLNFLLVREQLLVGQVARSPQRLALLLLLLLLLSSHHALQRSC